MTLETDAGNTVSTHSVEAFTVRLLLIVKTLYGQTWSNTDTLGWWLNRITISMHQYLTSWECDSAFSFLTNWTFKEAVF